MGFEANESESEALGTGTFNQSVFSPESMQAMYGQFNQLFPQTLSGMQAITPQAAQQMQQVYGASVPAWQKQMQGGAYANMPLQQMYQDALSGGGAEQGLYTDIMGGTGNDYVDAMKAQMQSDAWENLTQGLNVTDLRATGAGQPGSSRHGILQSNLMGQTQDALQQAQTQLGYETFNQDLMNKLGIAQRADQFDVARLQNVGNMLGAQQGAMMGGLGYGQNMQNLGMGQFSPYMMPWQAAGAYSNAMGSPTVLGSGTTSMSSDSSSKGAGVGK